MTDKPQTTKGGELNTNDPPTVKEVIGFLRQFDLKLKVRAYEGEGGAWILVDDEDE